MAYLVLNSSSPCTVVAWTILGIAYDAQKLFARSATAFDAEEFVERKIVSLGRWTLNTAPSSVHRCTSALGSRKCPGNLAQTSLLPLLALVEGTSHGERQQQIRQL